MLQLSLRVLLEGLVLLTLKRLLHIFFQHVRPHNSNVNSILIKIMHKLSALRSIYHPGTPWLLSLAAAAFVLGKELLSFFFSSETAF